MLLKWLVEVLLEGGNNCKPSGFFVIGLLMYYRYAKNYILNAWGFWVQTFANTYDSNTTTKVIGIYDTAQSISTLCTLK